MTGSFVNIKTRHWSFENGGYMAKKDVIHKIMKIVYFDEEAAQDYLDIKNGGHFDWSKEENKEKVAKLLLEIEAQAKAGFNLLSMIKAAISGNSVVSYSSDTSKIIDSTLKNTLLTDYINAANQDTRIIKFSNTSVYAPKDSVTMYKLLSSYLTVVPKEQLPIDMEKLNEALLGDRGYYEMLLKNEEKPKSVLRFNLKSFRDNYNLTDLSKMNLTYYGILVGNCKSDKLAIKSEFEFEVNVPPVSAEDVFEIKKEKISNDDLRVYDIVLAGVMIE
jgi:hypothetical protein